MVTPTDLTLSVSAKPPPAPTSSASTSARKLVSVRRVSKIDKIKHTNLAVAHLDGWQVVVGAGRFKAGELVVFFEIDSFLPETTWSWELFADEGRQENVMIFRGQLGYRVRSTRILGHLSQGLVMSLKDFPGINSQYHRRISEVGHQTATHELLSRSLAETLGVMKWEFTERAELVQNLGPPPPFIRPTGWFRIQDVEYDVFAPWNRNKIWYITEKLDGITMKVYKVARDSRWGKSLPQLPDGSPPTMQDTKNRYGVCSRKYDMMDREDNLFWKAAKASRVLNLLPQLTDFPNVAIIGELCGSSIEGNTMNYPDGQHEFIVFSIFDIDKGLYLPPKKTFEMCKELGLKHTPVIGAMTVWEFASNTQEMLDKAGGTGMYGGIREGFVFHSEDGKDHFKVISNSWLLKTGK